MDKLPEKIDLVLDVLHAATHFVNSANFTLADSKDVDLYFNLYAALERLNGREIQIKNERKDSN